MQTNSKHSVLPSAKTIRSNPAAWVSPVKYLSAAVVVAALGVASASADLFDVNFYNSGQGGVTATGAAVVGTPGDMWNGIDASFNSTGSSIALVNANNNPTSVTLSYSSDGAVTSAAANIQPNPGLMSDYIFDNSGGSVTLSLNNLSPNTPYDLYLYLSSNDAGGGSRAAQVTANGASGTATGDPQTTFINGENYLHLTPTSDGSGAINIVESQVPGGNSDNEVDVNGVQLQTIPEPTTISFFALGTGLAAFASIRARRKNTYSLE